MGCFSNSGGDYDVTLTDGWGYSARYVGFISDSVPNPPGPIAPSATVIRTSFAIINTYYDPFPTTISSNQINFTSVKTADGSSRKYQLSVDSSSTPQESIAAGDMPELDSGETGWTLEEEFELTEDRYSRGYGTITSSLGSISFDGTATSFAVPTLPTTGDLYTRILGFNDERPATGASSTGNTYWCYTGSGGAEPFGPPTLISPIDEATNVLLDTAFYWEGSSFTESYTLEVSEFEDFLTLIIDETTTNDFFLQESDGLENSTIYFWRVVATFDGETQTSEVWSFTTIRPSSNYCPYPDEKWTFNAVIKDRLANNYFGVAGGQWNNLVAYLCSNDTIAEGAVYIVLLRTREGESYVTTCERINYGKLPDILGCDDEICHALKWMFCGEKDRENNPHGLDKVSVGYIVSSDSSSAVVQSQIGKINIQNDWGSSLPAGTKVVIFNEDRAANFTKVLGPAQPL